MHEHADDETFSLAGRRVPRAFELRVVTLSPGQTRPYSPREWQDALVMVESGRLEIESVSGEPHVFVPGDVLWLAGLPLRALHNRGPTPCVLLAVARGRRPDRPR